MSHNYKTCTIDNIRGMMQYLLYYMTEDHGGKGTKYYNTVPRTKETGKYVNIRNGKPEPEI